MVDKNSNHDFSPIDQISSKTVHEVLIVGGGIVGIGIFRDLALHGINAVLIDGQDFCSQTSQSSSKMLHGGIRYLEQLDFLLVYEALHEKNLWIELAPHLCYELPFILPIYKESKHNLQMTRLGLTLYDLLSGFQNTPHQILNPADTIKKIPSISKNGLKGSGLYYDAIVDDAKLGLECLYDSLAHNPKSKALNYIELVALERISGKQALLAHLKDKITGKEKKIQVKEVVFAVGPFTDQLLKRLNCFNWKSVLVPSKGSHIWLNPHHFPIQYPMVLQTEDDRIIFSIPQKNGVLVGTTEISPPDHYWNLTITPKETDYLLNSLNHYFPNLKIGKEHILSQFAGVRPLVIEDGKDVGKTSREHKVYQPLSNVHVIVGGKYTTFRKMAQDICYKICEKNRTTYNPNRTKQKLISPSTIASFQGHKIDESNIEMILQKEFPRTFIDLIKRRIGVPSKNHWNQNQSQDCFDDYFIKLLPLLNKYIKVEKNDILEFS